ncbi:hypothetical protein BGX28_008333 [Mortierella sp. GBA30]|nr:hypothetical protein BGX28_008333 [Mortierella sp. GBA30]
MKPGPGIPDARVAPSADQSHLVVGGMGESGTPLVRIYDIHADTWSFLPSQPKGTTVVTPRSSVGIALDRSTGAVLVFGGLIPSTAFSRELDILDTRPASNNWTWVPVPNFVQLATLYQPISLYLPQLELTLLVGGCNGYYPATTIGSCQAFDTGFQIKTSLSDGVIATSQPNMIAIGSSAANKAIPPPRASPCYVVLANGDVFVYGGASISSGYSDAWVLNTRSWTWSPIAITNAPTASRAGATCQLIAPNQIIVVGGAREFSQPQIGIINTDTWTWGSTFTPSSTGALSLGVIIGIVAGSCFMLGIILFIVGRYLWKKRKASQESKDRASHSNIPLMGNSANSSITNLNTRPPKITVSTLKISNQDSSCPSSPVSTSRSSKDPRNLPLIITPYSPTSSSFSDVTFDSRNKARGSIVSKTEIGLPESERLPQTMADIQYGQYFKTAQHHKQYEKRLLDLQQQQHHRPLNRSDTTAQYTVVQNDDVEDHPYQATGVIDLKEIEFGEESIMIPLQPLQTGSILVSGHIEP